MDVRNLAGRATGPRASLASFAIISLAIAGCSRSQEEGDTSVSLWKKFAKFL